MDLSTRYMGLALEHPIVASAGPLSGSLDGIRRLEDGGVAAVVVFSLFEEQIRHENAAYSYFMESGSHSFAESLSYFPEICATDVGPEEYLNLVRKASEATAIPIIGSLNCVSGDGWIGYARQMQQAGAKGLELNIYSIDADLDASSGAFEQRYLDILAAVKSTVEIPVAMKLSPYFSAMGNMARRLDQAGADALVLFNRFYQPDIDIQALEVMPSLGLSSAAEIGLPLLWIALLHGRLRASLAATRGVETEEEVIKYLLAGADVVMTTSALLRKGPGYAATLREGLENWMDARRFSGVAQMRGVMSRANVADPGAYERANYIRLLDSYKSAFAD